MAGRRNALAESLAEGLVGHGLGRGAVVGAAPGRVGRRVQVEADEVVDVDPRQVLLAAGDRAADAELERRQHLVQRAAVGIEDDAGADLDDARVSGAVGRRVGLAFPGDADMGQEVVAGGGRLRHALVTALAVVTDGRGAHQDLRTIGCGCGHSRDEVAGADLTALEDLALDLVVPALGDRLAGEVDDGVAAAQSGNGRWSGERVPRDRRDTERSLGLLGGARQHRDGIAVVAQRADELGADQSGGAGEGDVHRIPLRTRRGGRINSAAVRYPAPQTRSCPRRDRRRRGEPRRRRPRRRRARRRG